MVETKKHDLTVEQMKNMVNNQIHPFFKGLHEDLKSKGYKKCTLYVVSAFHVGYRIQYRCFNCWADIELEDIGNIYTYEPENKKNRAFIYLLCKTCTEKAEDSNTNQNKFFDSIIDKILDFDKESRVKGATFDFST